MFGQKRIKELEKRIETLEDRNLQLYRKQFREGDLVYIEKEGLSNQNPVYLRKEYNGGDCYYFTKNVDDPITEDLGHAINVSKCSFKKPKVCDCCGQIVK